MTRRDQHIHTHLTRAARDLEAAIRSLDVAARLQTEAGRSDAAKAITNLANDLRETEVWDDIAGVLDEMEAGEGWVAG